MTSAVLFDWGDTLAGDVWTAELYRSATVAGLEAVGRQGLPEPEAIARCVAERERASPEDGDEVDLVAVYRKCFHELASPLTPDELEAYLAAVHAFWASIERPHPDANVLLERLRSRGLRLAIVANASSPRRFLERVLAEQGLRDRVDALVFSSDVGKRKPHPAVFERALAAVDARPPDAVFVGDRLYEDVLGASRLGMGTVQATWFVDDANERGAKPDARAGSPLDVLELVDG